MRGSVSTGHLVILEKDGDKKCVYLEDVMAIMRGRRMCMD
jgi:hypothetical protein